MWPYSPNNNTLRSYNTTKRNNNSLIPNLSEKDFDCRRIWEEWCVPGGVEEPALEDEAGGGSRAVVGNVQAVRKLVGLNFSLWKNR